MSTIGPELPLALIFIGACVAALAWGWMWEAYKQKVADAEQEDRDAQS